VDCQVLRARLDHRAARPVTDRPATSRYGVLTTSKDWRFGVISRADVADFLVRQVEDHALNQLTRAVQRRGRRKFAGMAGRYTGSFGFYAKWWKPESAAYVGTRRRFGLEEPELAKMRFSQCWTFLSP
jgi:hypothetical protein